ncbi:GNAT family N-acetyltransferase [Rhizobium helianthi]|uniref:GNAT family N-acetyltransferase n=1 Tax=Rhizobium helianthi TaxID=1132695 RepID=A0ABW4M209_9HYPH
MYIDVIETVQDFAQARRDWEAVWQADPHAQYFLSWDFLFRFLKSKQRWLILAARSAQKRGAPYVAFFPLRLQTRQNEKGMFVDEFYMAGNYSCDYTGLISLPEFEPEAIEAFATWFARQSWYQVKFDYFVGPPERREALVKALQGPLIMFRDSAPPIRDGIDNTICPVVTLPDDLDVYLTGTLGSRTRKEVRRYLRWMDSESEYRITHSTPTTVEHDLDILFHFWRIRWSAEKGEKTESMIASTRQMLMVCEEAGDLDVVVLWKGERPLGVNVNILDRHKRRLLFYITGRDLTWASDPAPGQMLHAHCIRRAIDEGFRYYDFLRGNEPYKFAYGSTEHRLTSTLFRSRSGMNTHGRLNSRSIRFVYEQALRLYTEGKKNEAEIAFGQVLQSAPGHRGAEFGLANLLFDRGTLSKAEAAWLALLPRVDDPVPVLLKLGDVRLARKSYRLAEETFGSICRVCPSHLEALYKRAVALVAMQRTEEAFLILSEVANAKTASASDRFHVEKARKALVKIALSQAQKYTASLTPLQLPEMAPPEARILH